MNELCNILCSSFSFPISPKSPTAELQCCRRIRIRHSTCLPLCATDELWWITYFTPQPYKIATSPPLNSNSVSAANLDRMSASESSLLPLLSSASLPNIWADSEGSSGGHIWWIQSLADTASKNTDPDCSSQALSSGAKTQFLLAHYYVSTWSLLTCMWQLWNWLCVYIKQSEF